LKRGPQGRYSKEFREEAVKLVTEERLSVPEAGRRLSLPPSTIVSWVKQFKAGKRRKSMVKSLTRKRILLADNTLKMRLFSIVAHYTLFLNLLAH